ncbi:probable methyltransferase TARBP1 isoform X2 [Cephus cinctus]|uniref:Probable methyltransferase TARBP1 isoform X2 n=1 Tax=Cephus cinctus TaxID=211228 RepID=A0AAJ7FTG8_CEPCN|nr:probable methyltransferase TARBP1 isoform X2 [Cephus cinctus]
MLKQTKHKKMDLDIRYKSIHTDISILQILDETARVNPLPMIYHLIKKYNEEFAQEEWSIGKLETFRSLLCYEYQLTYGPSCSSNEYYILQELDIPDIENIFLIPEKSWSKEELEMMLDIMILQTLLHCSIEKFNAHFEYFHKHIDIYMKKSPDARTMCLNVLGYFADTQYLQIILMDLNDSLMKELEDRDSFFADAIRLWLQFKQDTEWGSLLMLLPKIINTCSSEDATQEHIDQYIDTRFWTLILSGLKSPIEQNRKRALYLMKRAMDFLEIHEKELINAKQFCDKLSVPFLCVRKNSSFVSIDIIRKNFFLLMEALEEKQKHLIIPALPLINSLIDGNIDHKSCGNCFDTPWLQCIMERALHHENNAIVKWALLQAFKMDLDMYNDNFLAVIVNVLNNTFLYEYQKPDRPPEVSEQLSTLFTRAEEAECNLVNRFIVLISKVSWGPIAIYHVSYALSSVLSDTPVHNVWKAEQLRAVKELAETSLNMHSQTLRAASQLRILMSLVYNTQASLDLELIANTLAAFPEGEALARGAPSWILITNWLKEFTRESTINEFFEKMEKIFKKNSVQNSNIRTFTLMIMLLHDADLIFSNTQHCENCARRVLSTLFNTLVGIDNRPYAFADSTMRIIYLMSSLLNMCTLEEDQIIRKMITPYLDVILRFIQKSVRNTLTLSTCDDVNNYIRVVKTFLKAKDELASCGFNRHIEDFEKDAIEIINGPEVYQPVQRLFALYILQYCYSTKNVQYRDIETLLKTYSIRSIYALKTHGTTSTGRLALECYKVTALLIDMYLDTVPVVSWVKVNWLEHVEYIFERGGKEVIPEVLRILSKLISIKYKTVDKSTVVSLLECSWKTTFESKKSEVYWQAVEGMVEFLMRPSFFKSKIYADTSMDWINLLMREGENVPKLKLIFLDYMTDRLGADYVKVFPEAVFSCLLHGTVPRRDQRIELQTCTYIAKYVRKCFVDEVPIWSYNIDTVIRAKSTILLCKAISTDSEVGATFLSLAARRLESFKNKRYFGDSHLHRIKHRIMQVFLLIVPVLDEESIKCLHEIIRNDIMSESNQHSVRYMEEWLLILIYTNYNTMVDSLWDMFTQGHFNRPSCLTSAASIAYHVARFLPKLAQTDFLYSAISHIIPCCMGQQFNVRLYGQVVLVKLYELLITVTGPNTPAKFEGLQDAVIKSLQYGNMMKNSGQLQQDFYFTIFHPMDDYSLETIYKELPRLANISSDEWISPELFKALKFTMFNRHPMKHCNPTRSLSASPVSPQMLKSSHAGTFTSEDIDITTTGTLDMQKKITPWKSMAPLDEELSEISQLSLSRKKNNSEDGIIVVASLVDRLPNLGGLARTCEIFGAKELVISCCEHTQNREFQSLSVSAEKWITVTEVKPHQLQIYLTEKRDLGWELIGAEQTAKSISLPKMRFPKKTVLVLGNEKDGIPPNLIPLLDVCVEVPQVGVTRSLNVHVTGAICLWQYSQQNTFTECET